MTEEKWPITWWDFTNTWTEGRIGHGVFRNRQTGELKSSKDMPFGACYVDEHNPKGADGLSVVCKCPATSPADPEVYHMWYIDGRASNCTRKEDNVHRCWVRHGTIDQPLHVDKAGNTCNAGAGSIQARGWHGFLHNGFLSVRG